jgi:hypothetical protein
MARRRVSASPLAGVLTGLLAFLLAAPAAGTLIDIVVVATWESANVSPVINKLGFVDGDKFVMRAVYDDTTLFDGTEGVTATIDPTVNAGTSFNVIVPHAAGAPNPLLFDHADHTFIGFAPNAQIEFDGTDAVLDPGVFRNFEIHVDFSFAGDLHDFDTFKGPIQTETDMFNESQGYNLAAVGAGADHLAIVINDITANPGGPYLFDFANLSLVTNGSSGGGSGFPVVFDWTGPGGTLANSPGAAIAFGLAESGLANTLDSSTIDLVATELYTDFVSSSAAANVSYANAPPSVLSATGTNEADSSITFAATFSDGDLAANVLVPGFEIVTLEFLYNSVVFLVGGGNVLPTSLASIFPNALIFKMYGLTECKRVAYLEPELLDERPTSVGKAIPGSEAFVLDSDGRRVTPGEVGELHVRGPHVMMGYWKKPEQTRKMIVPGPYPGEQMLNTTDHFKQDEDGFLYFVGRSDDIIKTRGEKVSPAEVENVLHGIPGVLEAAVIGVSDALLGHAIHAYVALADGAELSERQIKKVCQSRLENFMVPQQIHFLDELPKTTTGKISKRGLGAGE